MRRLSQKLLGTLGIVAGLTLLLASPTIAASDESIVKFHVEIDVQSTGDLHFIETITYDFGSNPSHGILRDIPIYDLLPENQMQQYKITMNSILVDGQPTVVKKNVINGYQEFKIGDPDVLISGLHNYVIDYTITNGLKLITQPTQDLDIGDVDFYWDVIGDQWQVEIANASATIQLPGSAKKVSCTFGPSGSTTKCPFESSGSIVRSYSPSALPSGSAMTIAIQLPAGAFSPSVSPLVTDQPESWLSQFQRVFPYSLICAFILGLVIIFRALRKRGHTRTARIHEAVMFEPPSKLKPAHMAAAWRGSLDTKAFTATLLDLAARGIVLLTVDEDKRLVVTRADMNKPMLEWEQRIISVVLSDKDSVTMDQYRAEIAEIVDAVGKELTESATDNGLRNLDSFSARRGFVVATTISGIATIASVAVMKFPQVFAFVFFIALASFLSSLISIWITPKVQTEKSAQFLSEVLGFKKALNTDAAQARAQFAQRSGLAPAAIFATMLPFAVIYGIDKSWCAAYPDLTPDQLMTYGLGFATSSDLHRGVSAATDSLASSMTSPSSSGSGGGGGSSGGGGGGGGGRSW